MGSMAIDLQNGKLIDLISELKVGARESIEAKLADRGMVYCCAECLMEARGLSATQLVAAGLSGLRADSSFRRGGFRRQPDYMNGGYKEDLVAVRPAFWHPEPLLDEAGNRIERPCESGASIHHEYCRWIMASGRNWLLNGEPSPRHVVTMMARYIKDPSWREPDISVLWAQSENQATELRSQLDSGPGRLPLDRAIGLIAVEVQRSPISKPQLAERTKDHLERFADVRWVFVERHLQGLTPAREWLAEQGLTAYILREERDKSRIIGIEELPPPKRTKTALQRTDHGRCLRAVYIYWLKQGVHPMEAMQRAKKDWEDLKKGKHVQSANAWERTLAEIYGASFTYSDKQIWLRHKRRSEEEEN